MCVVYCVIHIAIHLISRITIYESFPKDVYYVLRIKILIFFEKVASYVVYYPMS